MNARFNTWVNGAMVKLTLRPGQTLTHATSEPTEEGYRHHVEQWEYDGHTVTRFNRAEGRDCDGRYSSACEQSCPVGLLRTNRYRDERWTDQGPVVIETFATPEWADERSEQRDYAAEAMGY